MRIENQKKNHLSTSTLASLLQTPIQARSLAFDPNDPFQQKIKRFKASHKKNNNHVCLNIIFALFCQYFLPI